MTDAPLTPIEIGLTAAIVAVESEEPAILVAGEGAETEARSVEARKVAPPKGTALGGGTRERETHAGDRHVGGTRAGLPFGPFDPLAHRTFEIGLRAWVEAQTGLAVGYVEQLYTFGDRGRHARAGRHRRARGLDRLSRAHPHAGERHGAARRRRRLRAMVPLLPLGGLARAAARHPRPDHPAAARGLGRTRQQARARTRARPPRAGAALLRRRRQSVGRGEGARPLRAALRGRPHRGGAARRPRSRAGAPPLPPAGRADALRSPAHPRDRDRAAARASSNIARSSSS